MLQPATLGLLLLAVLALQRLVAAGRAGHVVAVVLSAVLLLGGYHGLQTAGYYIRSGECERKPEDWLLRCRPFLEFRLDVWHKAALREIALRTEVRDAIYLGDVGFLTYVSECRTIDAFGLNDRRVANFYNSKGEERDKYYDAIMDNLMRRRPVLCFLVYDTEQQDYLMDLDRRLAHDSRFRTHYTWLQNLEYAGFSPKLVLHEFSRAPDCVHDAPAFLSRLEGMSRRYPLAADLYLWALAVADTSGLSTDAAKWRQRAASALPFWAQRQFGPTVERR